MVHVRQSDMLSCSTQPRHDNAPACTDTGSLGIVVVGVEARCAVHVVSGLLRARSRVVGGVGSPCELHGVQPLPNGVVCVCEKTRICNGMRYALYSLSFLTEV